MTNPIPRFSGAPVVEGVSADVVIVGSGVVGGLAAHALATTSGPTPAGSPMVMPMMSFMKSSQGFRPPSPAPAGRI